MRVCILHTCFDTACSRCVFGLTGARWSCSAAGRCIAACTEAEESMFGDPISCILCVTVVMRILVTPETKSGVRALRARTPLFFL